MSSSDPWHGDRLGRKEEAEDLLRFIEGRIGERSRRGARASYVLNIDSSWGQGKTFFLTRMRDSLKANKVPVAYVNAWETDFSDDPLVAIMSAIESGIKPFLTEKKAKDAWRGVVRSAGTLAISLGKNVAAKAAQKYTGEFVDDFHDTLMGAKGAEDAGGDEQADEDQFGAGAGISEGVSALADRALDRLIEKFRTAQDSIQTFSAQLSKVAATIQKSPESVVPIYIFVDELDRCRPLYAIRLLEAVKHLFETPGVVFLIATDTEQLSESVKAVYGSNFDGRKYLRRFFDRTYRLRSPSRSQLIENLFSSHNLPLEKLSTLQGVPHHILALKYFEDFGCTLRDIEQCFDILQTVCTLWNHRAKIELAYLLGLIILYQGGAGEQFESLSGAIDTQLKLPSSINESELVARRVLTGQGATKELQATTLSLLEAYRKGLKKPLPDFAELNLPTNLSAQIVAQRMQEEFQVMHNGTYFHNKPKPSTLLLDYRRYVELADRFETGAGE